MILIAVLSIVTALNVLMQLVDLHSSSEPFKRGFAHETNELLAKYLNDTSRPWAPRFWILVSVKAVCIALLVLPLFFVSDFNGVTWMIAFGAHAFVADRYFPQMRKNWAIYQDMLRQQRENNQQ